MQYFETRILYVFKAYFLLKHHVFTVETLKYLLWETHGALSLAEWHPIVYPHHTFSIHSSVKEQGGHYHLLATVSGTMVNTGVPMSLHADFLSFGYVLRSEIALHGAVLSFASYLPSFAHLHPHQQYASGAFSSTSLLVLLISCCFGHAHAFWTMLMPHCAFDVISMETVTVTICFSCNCWLFLCLLFKDVHPALFPNPF